jgi:hypothetical protein
MAPELAFAIIVVLIFAGIVAFAWFWTADPARQLTAAAECIRLKQQEAWLADRLSLARRERWEPALEEHIADQLAATRAQLRTSRDSVPADVT